MNKLRLTPIDYVFTGAGSQPITFAFSYPSSLDPVKLQRSLDQTLPHFSFLQSRLKRTSGSEYEFQPGDEGLTIEVRTSDLLFGTSRAIDTFITPVRSLEGEPLTRIVLTQTPGGSVLAASFSHALVDGFSYFHVLSNWARTCRGDRIMAPSFDRQAFESVFEWSAEEVTPEKITTDCGLFHGTRRPDAHSVRIEMERFFMPDATIGSLLQDARRQHGQSLTENDVITAHLWKKYLPSWAGDSGNPQTYLTCPFDFRRVLADFPKTYFGCALCFATAGLDLESVLKVTTGDLALLIRNSVGKIRSEHILRSMRTLEAFRRQRGLAAMEELHLRHPRHGMIVTNLTRMPISDIDFGSGSPVDFSAHVEVSGGAAILPGNGGVNIIVGHPAKE